MKLLKRTRNYYKYVLRYKPKEFICWLVGHRDLVTLPHAEICEQYWNTKHAEETKDTIDAFCRYCDSSWLIQNTNGNRRNQK